MIKSISINHRAGKTVKDGDGKALKSKKKKVRSVSEQDRARLVGGKDFAIIAITFEDKAAAMSTSDGEIQRLIKAKIALRKGYLMLAAVPVTPLTRIFQYRLSDKDRNKGMVYEVARSRRTVDGRLFYATTHGQKALNFQA